MCKLCCNLSGYFFNLVTLPYLCHLHSNFLLMTTLLTSVVKIHAHTLLILQTLSKYSPAKAIVKELFQRKKNTAVV